MPRPWFILGSVWEGDFGVLKPLLHSGVAGTLWVVPHRVDSLETLKIEACLVSSGLKSWVRSLEWERWGKEGRVTDGRWAAAEPAQAILVNEIGILSELYACADWAYVGGGFGAGVHSTIEPAMYGVPVATGPSQSERFPESELLRSTQQLRVVRTAEDLIDWWKFAGMAAPKFRERWLLQGREQLGAARRIAEMIRRASGLSLETRD